MKKIDFSQAQFIISAVEETSFPDYYRHGKKLPEIALVGRSNVGKSSLINHLTQKKSLAKTSSVPGKTQTINFYHIDEQFTLVDLPGYGYSKVTHSLKKLWADCLEKYLLFREQLSLIICVLDLRRTLMEEDAKFIDWAKSQKKPLFFIFSKSDKLSPKEKDGASESLAQEIQKIVHEPVLHLVYSVKDSLCRNLLRNQIERFLTSR